MIRFGALDFGLRERNAIRELIEHDDPQLTMGKKVCEFETKFAEWIESKHGVMVNSGTSALITAISAYSQVYGKPDFMSTTALTYPATWNAIRACGINLSIKDVDSTFVVHSKHDVAVHAFGKPSIINGIIEDTCQGMGGQYEQKHLGTFSLLGCFSFYVAHQINTIEGGMVVTDDSKLYEACLSIRDNGRICTCPVCSLKVSGKCSKRLKEKTERRWQTNFYGYNFKPTEIQGALGLARMETIDENIRRRNQILKIYTHHFGTLRQEANEFIVPMMYPIKVKNPLEAVAKLEKDGVEARGMFPAYSSTFKNAHRISQSHILIPLHHKMTDEDVDHVIDSCKNVIRQSFFLDEESEWKKKKE